MKADPRDVPTTNTFAVFLCRGSSGGASGLFAARDLALHTVNLLLLRAA